MAYTVDIPGQGLVDFGDEETARVYFEGENKPVNRGFLQTMLQGPDTTGTALEPISNFLKETGIENFRNPLNTAGAAVGGLSHALPGTDVLGAGIKMVPDYIKTKMAGGDFDVSDSFSENYDAARGDREALEGLNPFAASMANAAATIPQYGKLISAAGVNAGTGLGKRMLSPAAISPIIGQSQRGLELNPNASNMEMAIGAGSELAAAGINKVAEFGGKLKDNAPRLAMKAQKLVKKIPGVGGFLDELMYGAPDEELLQSFKAQESARKLNTRLENQAASQEWISNKNDARSAYNQRQNEMALARNAEQKAALSELKKGSRQGAAKIEAGSNLSQAESKSRIARNLNYEENATPVIEKYIDAKIPVQGVRDRILSVLRPKGFIGKNGSLNREQLNKISDPTLKGFYSNLMDKVDLLAKNPTLGDANLILDDFAQMADFENQASRGKANIFGKLYGDTRGAVNEALQSVAKGDDANVLSAANKAYSEQSSSLGLLKKALGRGLAPEQIVEKAGGNLPKSTIQRIVSTNPEMKEPLADVVYQNIISSADDGASLSGAIDNYGRNYLQSLLGPERYSGLLASERRLIAAELPLAKQSFVPPVKPATKLFEAAQPPERLPSGAERLMAAPVRGVGNLMSKANIEPNILPPVALSWLQQLLKNRGANERN